LALPLVVDDAMEAVTAYEQINNDPEESEDDMYWKEFEDMEAVSEVGDYDLWERNLVQDDKSSDG